MSPAPSLASKLVLLGLSLRTAPQRPPSCTAIAPRMPQTAPKMVAPCAVVDGDCAGSIGTAHEPTADRPTYHWMRLNTADPYDPATSCTASWPTQAPAWRRLLLCCLVASTSSALRCHRPRSVPCGFRTLAAVGFAPCRDWPDVRMSLFSSLLISPWLRDCTDIHELTALHTILHGRAASSQPAELHHRLLTMDPGCATRRHSPSLGPLCMRGSSQDSKCGWRPQVPHQHAGGGPAGAKFPRCFFR